MNDGIRAGLISFACLPVIYLIMWYGIPKLLDGWLKFLRDWDREKGIE